MYHDPNQPFMNPEDLAVLGADAIAYMRQISGEDIMEAFPGSVEVQAEDTYWALFAANGAPLMVANDANELVNSAFYNDLQAILPN